MRPKKIRREYKLRPVLLERIRKVKDTYDLSETETVERALEFGIITLSRFLAKNKKATSEAIEGSQETQQHDTVAETIGKEYLQRMQEIAKAKWIEED